MTVLAQSSHPLPLLLQALLRWEAYALIASIIVALLGMRQHDLNEKERRAKKAVAQAQLNKSVKGLRKSVKGLKKSMDQMLEDMQEVKEAVKSPSGT